MYKSHRIKNSEKAQACIRNLKPNSRHFLTLYRSLCTFFVLKNEQQKLIFEKENQTNYSTRKAIVLVSHLYMYMVMNILYYVRGSSISSLHMIVASVAYGEQCIVVVNYVQTDR